MGKYYILYNDNTNIDFNLSIIDRPSKPAPEMEYETVKVPGGKTLYREKGYKDVEITIEFNFLSRDATEWDKDFRTIKKWLLAKKSNKLKFSDDLEVYYRVNSVVIDTPERLIKRGGKFTATFTCEPYVYYDDDEIELSTIFYNSCLISKPIYRIVGEGYLTLNINNNVIKANIGQELIIDSDKGLCYREGIIDNVALEGKYEDMYLLEGDNTFSWTEGFEIYITPNLRCL